MSIDLSELKAKAAELDDVDRADLALSLLTSLDGPADDRDDVKKAWTAEIQRRIAEDVAGVADLVPGDEVFAQIRNKLNA